METLPGSPLRHIGIAVAYVLTVSALAVMGFVHAGWSLDDAIYMVVITVFSVGFSEVHPVVSDPFLRNMTIALIVLGCTGMIYLTGAIVQFFAMAQLRQMLGKTKMNLQIEALRNHIIICGFGRLGSQLAAELKAGLAAFVIIEQNPQRCAEIREMGLLYMQADATDEAVLLEAGILRARALATVVPSDAVNVFITLCARGLSPDIQILSRAESPSTERKLIQAGANAVVMPAHIGAEHAASLILFPQMAGGLAMSDRRRQMEIDLGTMGLEMEMVIAAPGCAFEGHSVGEIERQVAGRFMIVAVQHSGTRDAVRASSEVRIAAGDGLTVLGRVGRAEALRGFVGRTA